ncbi:hypothetical protein WDW86_20110 [Bdellovibrionota bacterium FG-2]
MRTKINLYPAFLTGIITVAISACGGPKDSPKAQPAPKPTATPTNPPQPPSNNAEESVFDVDPWTRYINIHDVNLNGFSFVVSLDKNEVGQTSPDSDGKWAKKLAPGIHTVSIRAAAGLSKHTEFIMRLYSGTYAPIYFHESLGKGLCDFAYSINDIDWQYLINMGKQEATCPIKVGESIDLEFEVSDKHPGVK